MAPGRYATVTAGGTHDTVGWTMDTQLTYAGRAALLVIRALVEHDIIDCDVQRVFRQRRFHFVSGALQGFWTTDVLIHFLHGLIEILRSRHCGLSFGFDCRRYHFV